MTSFLADIRHGLRLYARTPVASALAILGFAVAIGAVAAFVSLYADLVLRPHPGFERSSRIVTFGWTNGRWTGGLSQALIDAIADEAATLEAAAGAAGVSFIVGPDGQMLPGEMVTRDFFPGLRPRLALGRGFEPAEHQADGEPVVVISHAYWQQQFDGSADVLGRTVMLDGRGGIWFEPGSMIVPDGRGGAAVVTPAEPQGLTEFRIVGVMDARMPGTASPAGTTMYWLPIERALALGGADVNLINAAISMRGIGRRSPGAGAAAISNELNGRFVERIGARIEGLRNVRIFALDGLVFDIAVQRSVLRQLRLFLGASVLLAIVAAANMSLFLLARAPGRRRELGIRMSVGAPVRRLARQLASEASALVLLATMLGLMLSIWLAAILPGLSFLQDAQWSDITLFDWRVVVIVGACVLVLMTVVSLVPVIGLSRLGIAASSRSASARPSLAQRIAGAAQIGIAAALGGAAIAFAWYLGSLLFAHPGYETRERYAVSYSVLARMGPEGFIGISAADGARRRETILSLPGVRRVSQAGMVPGREGEYRGVDILHPDDPSLSTKVLITSIDAHYVDLLGLNLLRGRNLTETETGALLVNQALARALWGHDDVVGKSLQLFNNRAYTIVGVLDDLSYEHPDAEVQPLAFSSDRGNSFRTIAIVETSMKAADLQLALQGLVDSGSLDSIREVVSLGAIRGELIASDRARSALTVSAAVLVVLLTGVGFYGTQRYLVSAGRHEYAIRASIGAGPRALGRLVLWRGVQLGLPGLVFGLPLAFVVVGWLHDDYVSREISPSAVVVAAAGGIAALIVAASLGPARQARRTQPAPLLRED